MIGEYFIYLDFCAIALFLGMIFTVIYRKSIITSRGKFFLAMLLFGLISGIADISSISDYIFFKNWWSSGRCFTWTRD